MSIFESHHENSQYLSMHDENETLSRAFPAPFNLDDQEWPTVEHYYQAMKFEDIAIRQHINSAATTDEAIKYAKHWLRKFKIRKDWNNVKTTVMTRAIYIKCRTHPQIAETLLATADCLMVENSQFDYFWGCGRDKRGHNHYGKTLMNVRKKLTEEHTNSE